MKETTQKKEQKRKQIVITRPYIATLLAIEGYKYQPVPNIYDKRRTAFAFTVEGNFLADYERIKREAGVE